ncbi:MAG: hypothetical protein IH849_01850 [Acidobacteria bacterium]|nr:hypothetical protein [Acidobacteriota bacterium]
MDDAIINLKALCRALAMMLLGGAVVLSVASGAVSLTMIGADLSTFSSVISHCSWIPERAAIRSAAMLGDSAVILSSKGSAAFCQGHLEQRSG